MAHAERRGPQVLNIGEVLAQLSDDFPSMTASKIRFLEEKGLINPQRTPAGYRQYAENDVERLRFVLSLQRDQYLPLKVIKDYLDAIDRGERPENLPPGVTVSPRIVSEELASELQNRVRRLSEEQLRAESGASVPAAGIAPELRPDRPRQRQIRRDTPSRSRAPASSWRAMAWNPATCGPSRRLPSANSGSWSVLWPP